MPTDLQKSGYFPTLHFDLPTQELSRCKHSEVQRTTGSVSDFALWISLLILQTQPALVLRASLIPALSNNSHALRSGADSQKAAQRELHSSKEHKAELQNQTGGILHPSGPCQAPIAIAEASGMSNSPSSTQRRWISP